MNALIFEGQGNSIEISALIESDAALPSAGDAYVKVAVSSAGFVGHNDLWLQREELQRFLAGLASLDQTLRGEATLKSISPDELELTIQSVSSRGHLAVLGKTGYLVRTENTEVWHSISFGFEFEPSQLSQGLSNSWLRNYAV